MTGLATAIAIDPDGAAPYEQVRAAVVDLIRRGELVVGERMPTVRALAGDLGLAANTVARSYRELEAAGVIETRGRHGSFVKTGPDALLGQAQSTTLAFVRDLRDLGIDDDTIITLVTRVVRPS